MARDDGGHFPAPAYQPSLRWRIESAGSMKWFSRLSKVAVVVVRTALQTNAISNSVIGILTVQRGRPRIGNVDIGAYEWQPPTKVIGVVVNNGSAQRSMVNQLKVTFDSPVTFVGTPASAFLLTRQSDNKAVNLAVAMDSTNQIATLTFTGRAVENKSLADGRYTLNVLANQFAADGFDGNGDGTAGDNYAMVGSPANGLFRMFGDADGNGIVDGVDFGAFRTTFNTNSNVFDFDGSGVVDGSDFGQFRQRFGSVI